LYAVLLASKLIKDLVAAGAAFHEILHGAAFHVLYPVSARTFYPIANDSAAYHTDSRGRGALCTAPSHRVTNGRSSKGSENGTGATTGLLVNDLLVTAHPVWHSHLLDDGRRRQNPTHVLGPSRACGA
jgi:hypothetical protein